MALSESKTLQNKEFTARCLTTGQVNDVLKQTRSRSFGEPVGVVEFLAPDRLPYEAFYLSLGIEEKDLYVLEQSDVVELMEMVEKINPILAEGIRSQLENAKEQASLLSNLRTSAPT